MVAWSQHTVMVRVSEGLASLTPTAWYAATGAHAAKELTLAFKREAGSSGLEARFACRRQLERERDPRLAPWRLPRERLTDRSNCEFGRDDGAGFIANVVAPDLDEAGAQEAEHSPLHKVARVGLAHPWNPTANLAEERRRALGLSSIKKNEEVDLVVGEHIRFVAPEARGLGWRRASERHDAAC